MRKINKCAMAKSEEMPSLTILITGCLNFQILKNPNLLKYVFDPSLGPSNDCADVNECISGQNDCSENADCLNTEGSYRCQCHSGYR